MADMRVYRTRSANNVRATPTFAFQVSEAPNAKTTLFQTRPSSKHHRACEISPTKRADSDRPLGLLKIQGSQDAFLL